MKGLIVGGDSRLASYLQNSLRSHQVNFVRTTRRIGKLTDNQIFLDFADITTFSIPKDVTTAVIIGGITDYTTCETDYPYAHYINCVQIPSLVGELLKVGIHVCFISTNTVFTSPKGLPTEYKPHNPSFNYAKLKSIAEHKILAQAQRVKRSTSLSILRLTKNVGHSTSPFDSWVEALSAGKTITAFDDLFFAPVLFSHSAEAIYDIICLKLSGIFHLSGETDISYADFADGLVSTANQNPDLVKRVSSKDVGVSLIFSHQITGLDMQITSRMLGIKPIPLKEVYLFLSKMCTKAKKGKY